MMTRGVAVLEAAIHGKRIRPADARWAFPGSRWLTLDEKRRWFWDENHVPAGFSVNSLFTQDWEIEEPQLTGIQAVHAMDEGKIVERPLAKISFWRRVRQEAYQRGYESELIRDRTVVRPWADDDLTYKDIHATDWRIVGDQA